MHLKIKCVAAEIAHEVLYLRFGLEPGRVIDLSMQMAVHADRSLEPDLHSIKVGD